MKIQALNPVHCKHWMYNVINCLCMSELVYTWTVTCWAIRNCYSTVGHFDLTVFAKSLEETLSKWVETSCNWIVTVVYCSLRDSLYITNATMSLYSIMVYFTPPWNLPEGTGHPFSPETSGTWDYAYTSMLCWLCHYTHMNALHPYIVHAHLPLIERKGAIKVESCQVR